MTDSHCPLFEGIIPDKVAIHNGSAVHAERSSYPVSVKVWAQALATGTLLSPKLQAQRVGWSMQSVQSGGPYGLALAAISSENAIGHNGGLPGYTTEMWYMPGKHATTVVVIANGDNDGLGQDAATQLLTQLFLWL